MKFPLFWLLLHKRRKLLGALALGLLAFQGLMVVVAVAIPTDELFAAKPTPESLNAFSGSSGAVALASIAGLLGAGLLHPFWIAMQLAAVSSLGAALVAGDVEDGTIELVAIRPVSRVRLVLERLAAMVLTSAVLSALSLVPICLGTLFFERISNVISLQGAFSAAVAGYALALCFIGIAVAVSCSTSRRATVLSLVGGAAAVTYALNFIAEAWKPASFTRWLSPFQYYRPADALVLGSPDWLDIAILVAVGAAGVLIGLVVIRRRDLTY